MGRQLFVRACCCRIEFPVKEFQISRTAQKRIVECILYLPCIVYIALIFIKGLFDLDNWRLVLTQTGFIACGLLLFLLSLNPLRRVYPTITSIAFINRFRRQIGVAVFVYALLHYIAVILKKICKTGNFWPSYLLQAVPLTGIIAFILLFLLAITSNDYSIRKLGGRRWKQLHRWAYVIEALIVVHLVLQGGSNIAIACIIFIPVVALQLDARRL